MKHFILTIALSLALLAPVFAQETGYTPSDDEVMQNCFETIGDALAGPDIDINRNYHECIGEALDACQEESLDNQTTSGIFECAKRETQWWDEVLNHNYAILKNALDAEEFQHLQTAQRAWLAFREAECGFHYFYWRLGTIGMVYGSTCMMETTAKRALTLGNVINWVM